MKKRFLQIIAAASITTVALTGCGAKKNNKADSNNANSSTNSSVSSTPEAKTEGSTALAKDGTFEGVGQGNNGEIKVNVTFADGKITNVEVAEHGETAGICENAFDRIPGQMVENNTVKVDTVTGATNSSKGLIEAVSKAIEAAGGSVDAYSAAIEKAAGETKTVKTQVVVVGAGAAGTTAALQAAQSGAEVVLLEKSSAPGGISVLAGGIFAVNSKDQVEAGANNFTFQQVLSEWMDYNCWLSDANLFYNILGNSGETADWLEENGVDFTYTGNEQAAHADAFPTYLTYSSNQNDVKGSYFANMVSKVEEAGGTVYFETPATELIYKDGKVTGVVAQQADGTRLEIACDAVVLATGGSGANAELIEEINGFPLYTVSTGTQTGDGLNMAKAIGAGEGNMIQEFHGVTSYVTTQPGLGTDVIGRTIYFPGSVWVNQNGYRFAPEDINFDTALTGNAAFAQGEYFFSVISEQMVQTLEKDGIKGLGVETSPVYIPGINLYPVDEAWDGYQAALDAAIAEGMVVKGDSLEELAKEMGVNAESLAKTMNTYNEYCADGEDSMLGKDGKYLIEMGKGPFYAVKGRPVSLGAIGGLSINSELQVLDTEGQVMTGLYVAGNEVGAIYNNTYPLVEGVSLGVAFNSGRLAGKLAGEFVAK